MQKRTLLFTASFPTLQKQVWRNNLGSLTPNNPRLCFRGGAKEMLYVITQVLGIEGLLQGTTNMKYDRQIPGFNRRINFPSARQY